MRLESGVPSDARDYAAAHVRDNFRDECTLLVEGESYELGFDPGQVTAVASLIVAAVALIIQYGEALRERAERREWTPERFREALKMELLKQGILRAELLQVENFASLIDAVGPPCTVTARDRDSGRTVLLVVKYDGEIYRFDCQE